MARFVSRFFLVSLLVLSAPVALAVPRILIVGDSWAQGVWVARALDQVLLEYNIQGVETEGSTTAIGGTTANGWAGNPRTINSAIQANPTIDSVHLIIGGNDILGKIKSTNVYTGIDQYLREGYWNQIQADVQTIVNHCLSFPQIYVKIRRAAELDVTFIKLDGRPQTVHARGLLARAVQHELDHLDGVLAIDRVDKAQRKRILRLLQDREMVERPPANPFG